LHDKALTKEQARFFRVDYYSYGSRGSYTSRYLLVLKGEKSWRARKRPEAAWFYQR